MNIRRSSAGVNGVFVVGALYIAAHAVNYLTLPPTLRDTPPPPWTPRPGAPRLHHLTIATKPAPGLELMLASATRFGYATTVLGMNETRALGHASKSWGLRLMLLRDAAGALPVDDLVLVSDAYDVLFQRPAVEFVQTVQEWEAAQAAVAPAAADAAAAAPVAARRKTLLFAGEKLEWPDVGMPYTTQARRFPYINAGMWVGRARDVARAVSGGYDLGTDDQRFFTAQYLGLAGPAAGELDIDHDARVFGCFSGLLEEQYRFGTRDEWEGGPPRPAGAPPPPRVPAMIFPGGATPFLLHHNGGYKSSAFRVSRYLFAAWGGDRAEPVSWAEGSRLRWLWWRAVRLLLVWVLPQQLSWGVTDGALGKALAAALCCGAVAALARLVVRPGCARAARGAALRTAAAAAAAAAARGGVGALHRDEV